MIERFDTCVSRHPEPASQVIPERDAVFGARFGQAKERVPAIATDVASCSGTDLPPGASALTETDPLVLVETDPLIARGFVIDTRNQPTLHQL
jgi:hypothetical protein